MIQRIQSVLILIAIVLLGLEFVFPFATNSASSDGVFADSIYNVADSPILLGLLFGGIILGLIALFLFKQRSLQIKTNWVAGLLCLAVLATAYFLSTQAHADDFQNANIGIGAFLPIVSFILFIIANRFIGKDENLVKSMDRLR